jgi:hypothetical protein
MYSILLQLDVGDFLGDVLEFGFWTVLIIVVLIILLAVWLYRKFKGKFNSKSRGSTGRPHDFR